MTRLCARFAVYAKPKCIFCGFGGVVLQIQFTPSKRKEQIMNSSSTHTNAVWNAQSLNTDALATLHENAKQRAQALRREAVSGLIDGMIAWVVRRGDASRSAASVRSEALCRS
jgi:hypothetical protein